MKKLLLLAFCLLAFPAFGQTLASPGGGSSATFPTICPAPVASGQILYDNAGACGGITGWTTNGTTTITGAASTTLAVGGATIGTNALAVTGTGTISGVFGTTATGASSAPSLTIRSADLGFYSPVAGEIFYASNTGGTGALVGFPRHSDAFLRLRNTVALSWTSGDPSATADDVVLTRDAANTLAQRNGVNAQTVRVYGTFTDTSNYERAYMTDNGSGTVTFGGQGAGTGVGVGVTIAANDANGSISFQVVGATPWKVLSTGHLVAPTDNTYDIGASGATRPRTLYLGTTDASSTSTGALVVAGGGVVAKRFWIPAITASAGLQTAVLCQSSGGEMIADSVACLASSARFKNLAGPMEDGALTKLAALPMRRWNYKPEGIFHNDVEHVGPIAEDVAAMDSRLAGYDKDGKVRTYSTEQLLAYTIKALQELKADNDNLRQEMKRASR